MCYVIFVLCCVLRWLMYSEESELGTTVYLYQTSTQHTYSGKFFHQGKMHVALSGIEVSFDVTMAFSSTKPQSKLDAIVIRTKNALSNCETILETTMR